MENERKTGVRRILKSQVENVLQNARIDKKTDSLTGQELKKDNMYVQFIDYLLKKRNPKGTRLHKHRVLPAHSGGVYEDHNVLYLSYRDHYLAHAYRYVAFKNIRDYRAYLLLRSFTEQSHYEHVVRSGRISAELHKKNKTLFFDKEWQALYGDRSAGQRNVASGHMHKLNKMLTKEQPEQRSRAGKIGGRKVSLQQRAEKKHFFEKNNPMQRKGNLKRWGIKVDGIRVPYEKLSSEFIEYHIRSSTQKEYTSENIDLLGIQLKKEENS